MDTEVDYSDLFDDVVFKYLAKGGMVTFRFAYGNNFFTRSTLHTICLKELHLSNKHFDQREIDLFQELMDMLSEDGCSLSNIESCIDFLLKMPA